MEYCYSWEESLWYGSLNSRVCHKGKCADDRPSRSTGADQSRKQRCCFQSCLLSQAQRDISDQDNSENLDYWLTRRHPCIDMWSWTEMLTVSFQPRARLYDFRFGMPTICWNHPPTRRPRKCCRLETLACCLCHLQCACFLNQNVPWQNRVLCDLKLQICIFDFHFVHEWVLDDCCKPVFKFLVRNCGIKGRKIEGLDASDKVENWRFKMF